MKNLNDKNNVLVLAVPIVWLLVLFVLCKFIFYLILSDVTKILLRLSVIESGMFPELYPVVVTILIVIFIFLIFILQFNKKIKNNSSIKKGNIIAFVLFLFLFLYFTVYLFIAIFNIDMPSWFYL